ncbi:hypothetical protein V1478_002222 [Vespula squamosa]|uniref:Uncharacterized protein n=1 Tax=Vespula squamosa TaxID=30214 RepID=A0ABD2BW70_VESSQ
MTKRNCIHGQIIDRKSVENIPRYHLHLSIDMSEKRENRSLTHEESRPRFKFRSRIYIYCARFIPTKEEFYELWMNADKLIDLMALWIKN